MLHTHVHPPPSRRVNNPPIYCCWTASSLHVVIIIVVIIGWLKIKLWEEAVAEQIIMGGGVLEVSWLDLA